MTRRFKGFIAVASVTVLLFACVGFGVHAASSLETVLRVGGPIVKRIKRVSLTSLVFAGVGALLAYYSFRFSLLHALRVGGFKRFCAILALLGPVVVASYVSLWPAFLDRYRRLRLALVDGSQPAV